MQPGSIYHLYSHANGFELLFNQAEDYEIFLEKMVKYMSPIAEIYSYCLMPNHFHFLTEMKTEEEIAKISGRKTAEKFISKSIGNWRYSSYKEILEESRPWLNSKTVLDYFNGQEEFIKYHKREIERKLKEKSYF